MHATITISDRMIAVRLGDAVESRCLDANAAELEPAALAERILDASAALCAARTRATLIIPACWCYMHRVSMPQRRPSRQALAFGLEEFIPLDIEQLTCEFVRTPHGDHIGVALESERIAPLLAALGANDIWVERITLAALEAITCDLPARLLWCDEEHAALLTSDEGGLCDLQVLRFAAQDSDEAWCDRAASRLTGDGRYGVRGCASRERLEMLSARIEGGVMQTKTDGHARATLQFNLARDRLAPPSLGIDLLLAWRRTAVAALLAMLLLTVGLAVQRSRLAARLDEVQQWEQQVFEALFPSQPQPAGVALRLASERKRLQALTMSGPGASETRPDALRTLQSVVACLPDDMRVEFQEIRIEGRDVTLRGRTRDHRQAERITAGIDHLDSLACGPPRTDRHRAGGVQFHIHASRSDDALRRNAP